MPRVFAHKKSLGQHFLTSDVVPQWMCDAADITASDMVVEIGPGTGVLTKELLKRGAVVIALEADQRAVAHLEQAFADEIAQKTLFVHHTDVRQLDLQALPELRKKTYKVVANIPYYLSGFLFRSFLEADHQPKTLVFLVQKEVAKRAASSHEKGQKESLLSLSVQAYGTPKYYKTVAKGNFDPPPKVDSAIIAIHNISKQNFQGISEETFFTILHYGFAQKRKQLLGNLSHHYDREKLMNIFSTLGLALDVRAEDIALKTWLQLTREIINMPSTGS